MTIEIDRDELVAIARIVDRSDCPDFVLEAGGITLRLTKGSATPAAAPDPSMAPPVGASPVVAAPAAAPVSASPAPAPASPPASPPARAIVEGYQLKAPMLGTFYRAPSPGALPFVEEGSRVVPGTTLCIIEVMKVMNTVKADRAGTVVAIYAENAAMVEFGEVLMVIREDAAA